MARESSAAKQSDAESLEAVAPVTFQRRKSKVSKGEGLWLMSFSDMSLILMSFFVLQLSFSNPDKRKYDNLNSAISQSAKVNPDNLQAMSDKISKVIKQKKLENVASVSLGVNGLNIEFKDATLFATGSADPSRTNAKLVDEVMNIIAKAPPNYRLVFEGHTDDTPINNGKFSSNWDLASARGVALLKSFKARGVGENRMSVVAFAATQPKVRLAGIKDPQALQKARAANRRVVIRLE